MIMPHITSVYLPFSWRPLVKSGKLHQWEDKILNSSDQDELKNFFFNFPDSEPLRKQKVFASRIVFFRWHHLGIQVAIRDHQTTSFGTCKSNFSSQSQIGSSFQTLQRPYFQYPNMPEVRDCWSVLAKQVWIELWRRMKSGRAPWNTLWNAAFGRQPLYRRKCFSSRPFLTLVS